MRYIADSSGRLKEIAWGAMIICGGVECTEYTGIIPAGYDSLEDWYISEFDKLYRWKVVNGNLVLNSSATAPDPDREYLTIAQGGTGATNEKAARTNLGFAKKLWSGNWYEGSITVPGTGNYRLFIVRYYNSENSGATNYTSLVAKISSSIRGVGGGTTADYSNFITSLSCTFSDETWSSPQIAAYTHTQNSNHADCYDWAISDIWGVC